MCTPYYSVNFTFKPPYPQNYCSITETKQNNWLTNNFHNIQWEDGNNEYSKLNELIRTFKLQDAMYYAKGLEKCAVLSDLFIVEFNNLDDLNCPKFCTLWGENEHTCLSFTCSSFPNKPKHLVHCAENKASLFYDWSELYLSTAH